MCKYILLFFLVISLNGYSQIRTGLVFGSGLGFERSLTSKTNENVSEVKNLTDYQFGFQLGYRFRIENEKKWFYDIDILGNVKVFKTEKIYMDNGSSQGAVLAHDANGALAVSPSVNYKMVKGLYAGIGVEPTWYVFSEGAKFDVPVVWKVGYNIKNKIDIALNYRLGFTNTIDDEVYKKGKVSDLNLSIFIPFTVNR